MKKEIIYTVLLIIFFALSSWQYYKGHKFVILYNNARDLANRGDFQNAYKISKEAVEDSKNIFFNFYNANYALTLCQLAEICYPLGKYDEMEKSYRTASAYYGSGWSSDNKSLANTYFGIGQACFGLSKLNEAETYYKRALALYAKLGEICSDDKLDLLGLLYFTQKKYDSAKEYYLDLVGRKGIENGDPNYFAFFLSQVGLAYYFQKDFKKAESFEERGEQILVKLYQQDPKLYRRGLRKALINLANIYFCEKRYEKMANFARWAMKLVDLESPEYYDEMSDIFACLAEYEKLQNHVEKAKMYKEKEKMMEKHVGIEKSQKNGLSSLFIGNGSIKVEKKD